jgi:hypothetical protein
MPLSKEKKAFPTHPKQTKKHLRRKYQEVNHIAKDVLIRYDNQYLKKILKYVILGAIKLCLQGSNHCMNINPNNASPQTKISWGIYFSDYRWLIRGKHK